MRFLNPHHRWGSAKQRAKSSMHQISSNATTPSTPSGSINVPPSPSQARTSGLGSNRVVVIPTCSPLSPSCKGAWIPNSIGISSPRPLHSSAHLQASNQATARKVSDEIQRGPSLVPSSPGSDVPPKSSTGRSQEGEVRTQSPTGRDEREALGNADYLDVKDKERAEKGLQLTREWEGKTFFQKAAFRWRQECRMVRSLLSISRLARTPLLSSEPSKEYPEMEWPATLRRTSPSNTSLCKQEISFVQNRKKKIAEAFKRYLGLNDDVRVEDIPIVGLGGSGGGFRAMLGFMGTISAMKESGEWDLLTYIAGVSGSCWAIASYYTWAELKISRAISHFRHNSKRHPLLPKTIHRVLRSPDGPLHTFGSISLKHAAGLQSRAMDLYGAFLTAGLWLPSEKDAREVWNEEEPRIRKEWLKWSLTDRLFQAGNEPMPILTAVRHERPLKDWASLERPFRSSNHKTWEHRRAIDAWYQWFEFTPYEVGCDELDAWCPTYAFGRYFRGGQSLQRLPEHSLALILGLATSAPAGPLSTILGTLQRNLPRGFISGSARFMAADLAKYWGPLRTADFLNRSPLYASNVHNFMFMASGEKPADPNSGGLEQTPLIEMIDSGLDDNTPLYTFVHPSRDVDVAILFDASSDVNRGAFTERLSKMETKKGFSFERLSEPPPTLPAGSSDFLDLSVDEKRTQIAEKFKNSYAQVFRGTPTLAAGTPSGHQKKSPIGVPLATRGIDVVYVPLLPNQMNPEYDPSTSRFSGSYNLKWTEEQVDTVVQTAKANWREGAEAVKGVLRAAYEAKKQSRLLREGA